MTVWLGIAAISVAVAVVLIWPLLQRRPDARHEDGPVRGLAVYRDQLAEIDRDLERGLLNPDEAAAARVEIERRLLGAAGRSETGSKPARRQPVLACLLALAVVAGSLALYGVIGSPGLPSQPLAERTRQARVAQAESGDIAGRAALLRERLERAPGSAEGWVLLARTYVHLQRFADAAEAYRRALELTDDRGELLSGYAEALTLSQGNRVPPAARLAFEQVLAARPDDPRARYYLGLHDAQAQRFDAALRRWQALLADSPPTAPWRPIVVRGIRDMAGFLDIDVAEVLSAEDRQSAAATDPVAALRAGLESNPKDWQGWLKLARAEVSRGDRDAARVALDRASALYPNAPFIQQQIRSAAAELGLAEGASNGRGPSPDDMTAAAEMSESERSDMIEGMVAGLAARLESEPDDLTGWLMLIRSYAVLGREDQARLARDRALAHFAAAGAARQSIRQTAAEVGLTP